MAYDQHSSYEAPRRGYNGQHGAQYGGGQQRTGQFAQEYGTLDPYAEDVGGYHSDGHGQAQQDYGHANGYGIQGYGRQRDERAYTPQGRGLVPQSYGRAQGQQQQQQQQQYQRGPAPQQYDGRAHGYHQQQQQYDRGYEGQGQGQAYARQDHQGGRIYDQHYPEHSSRHAGHNGQQQGRERYEQQSAHSNSRAATYDYDTPAQQQYSSSQGSHTQRSGHEYAQQDERRYDPRYQQRTYRAEPPHAVTTSANSYAAPQDEYALRQADVRSPPKGNGTLQSSYSAPVLSDAGPKKLTMDEWKAQEKARLHGDARKPKIVAQDNAFPTFPTTKKADSTRGESALSMRSAEERPSTASSVRPSDRPLLSRNDSSQNDLTDSARPSLDHKSYTNDSSARPSFDAQYRNGSPLSRSELPPPPVTGRPARKDSYSTSARPVISPLNTSDLQRSAADVRPMTADARYARKQSDQPMSPLGQYAQSAREESYESGLYRAKSSQALSREEQIEAEMPNFDSAAPSQATRQRRQTIEQHLTITPPAAAAASNFDFGFASDTQELERPVKPYASEVQERRSMDEVRQGSRSLVHGRPPPQRFYPEALQAPRPGFERQGTTYSDPGMQRAGSVPPQNSDALPAHPVPVRPGLLSSTPVSESRPPPIRNYQNNASPSPSQSSSRVPSGVETPKQQQPITHAELQQLRSQVEANPQSLSLSLVYAKKLVEAAKVLSSDGGRADAKTAAKNRERYLMEAYKRVKKLSSSGYPDGQFYLGDCYSQGALGLEVDAREAFKLYQAAAKAGHATAAYRTAVCCEIGSDEGGGTSRDYPRAVQWYKRAAALGETAAMFKIGMIALKGLLGQPRHLGEATIWLKRAAERADRDNPHALHELAQLYETANSTPEIRLKVIPDDEYALQLYKQAAELGSRNAQFRLGQCFEYGQLGLPVDHRSSIAWYSKSAAQGNHEAELALSGWYLTGAPGILQQSDVEAYLWARKAAQSEPPLAKSLFALGYYNEAGIGCPVNIDEAKRWYSRAASYKHPKALERLDAIKRGAKGGYKAMPTNARGKLNRKDQHQDESECSVM